MDPKKNKIYPSFGVNLIKFNGNGFGHEFPQTFIGKMPETAHSKLNEWVWVCEYARVSLSLNYNFCLAYCTLIWVKSDFSTLFYSNTWLFWHVRVRFSGKIRHVLNIRTHSFAFIIFWCGALASAATFN